MGNWRLTADYRWLNSTTGPLTAAVPNMAELRATRQEQAHQIMATIDVKDMPFMVPSQEQDQERFAFTWEGQQCTFTRLPQGFKHSPTLAHHARAQELSLIPPAPGVRVYQYIDDILVAADEITPVQTTQTNIIKPLESLDLHIPPEKVQLPSQEVEFLGIWVERRNGVYSPRHPQPPRPN